MNNTATTKKHRAKSTRIYPVGNGNFVHLSKEYEMKYGRNLYYVYEWGVERPKTLGKFSSFKEARGFVRDLFVKTKG